MRKSGAARRRERVEQGLPRYTEAELEGRKRYAANRVRTEQRQRDRARLRERVAQIKVERGCADCGYSTHPAALDFDHLPGAEKVDGIGTLVAHRASWAAIELEMAKCEVVCANCHRVRTALRGSGAPSVRE